MWDIAHMICGFVNLMQVKRVQLKLFSLPTNKVLNLCDFRLGESLPPDGCLRILRTHFPTGSVGHSIVSHTPRFLDLRLDWCGSLVLELDRN